MGKLKITSAEHEEIFSTIPKWGIIVEYILAGLEIALAGTAAGLGLWSRALYLLCIGSLLFLLASFFRRFNKLLKICAFFVTVSCESKEQKEVGNEGE